jgi:hypothetical protein
LGALLESWFIVVYAASDILCRVYDFMHEDVMGKGSFFTVNFVSSVLLIKIAPEVNLKNGYNPSESISV